MCSCSCSGERLHFWAAVIQQVEQQRGDNGQIQQQFMYLVLANCSSGISITTEVLKCFAGSLYEFNEWNFQHLCAFWEGTFFFFLSSCLRNGNITDGANPGATSSMSFTRKALAVNTFRAGGKPSSNGSSEQGTKLAKTRLVWGLQHPQATEYTPQKSAYFICSSIPSCRQLHCYISGDYSLKEKEISFCCCLQLLFFTPGPCCKFIQKREKNKIKYSRGAFPKEKL